MNRPIGRVRTGLPRIDPSVSFPLGHGHQSVDVLQIIPEGQLPEGFVSSVRSAGCIGIEDPVGIESPVRRPVPEEDEIQFSVKVSDLSVKLFMYQLVEVYIFRYTE